MFASLRLPTSWSPLAHYLPIIEARTWKKIKERIQKDAKPKFTNAAVISQKILSYKVIFIPAIELPKGGFWIDQKPILLDFFTLSSLNVKISFILRSVHLVFQGNFKHVFCMNANLIHDHASLHEF